MDTTIPDGVRLARWSDMPHLVDLSVRAGFRVVLRSEQQRLFFATALTSLLAGAVWGYALSAISFSTMLAMALLTIPAWAVLVVLLSFAHTAWRLAAYKRIVLMDTNGNAVVDLRRTNDRLTAMNHSVRHVGRGQGHLLRALLSGVVNVSGKNFGFWAQNASVAELYRGSFRSCRLPAKGASLAGFTCLLAPHRAQSERFRLLLRVSIGICPDRHRLCGGAG
jgi:hypothetical protein